jgi:hypothetical protein
VGSRSDQTGENLTAERAGAGTRRVKPKETDPLWTLEKEAKPHFPNISTEKICGKTI